METTTTKALHKSTLELSVRRKASEGLPGDDPSLHNLKIGGSIHGKAPLSGLTLDEQLLYLPDIIGVSAKDNSWNAAVKDYWNNISVVVPAEGVTTNKLQGLLLSFTILFENEQDKKDFEEVISFEKKAEISQKGKVIDGVDDYVLFRYCLKYSRVANSYADIHKSAKIRFYLYSTKTETLSNHKNFKQRMEAKILFGKILSDEGIINSILLLFGQDLTVFETLQDKHLALEASIDTNPSLFIKLAKDTNLKIKAAIKTAAVKGILHNPANTETYYFGESNEICLGNTLEDSVLYWKNANEKNQQIVSAIKARLKLI